MVFVVFETYHPSKHFNRMWLHFVLSEKLTHFLYPAVIRIPINIPDPNMIHITTNTYSFVANHTFQPCKNFLIIHGSVVVKTFFRSRDQDRDLGHQVSRPRPRPGQNELECTRVSRPRSRDHITANQHTQLLTGRMPFLSCRPTNSVEALKGTIHKSKKIINALRPGLSGDDPFTTVRIPQRSLSSQSIGKY